jgi:hypothetical protein
MGAKGIISEEYQDKHKVTMYLPSYMVKKLKHVGNQSAFITECVEAATGWTNPKTFKKVVIKTLDKTTKVLG